MFTIEEYSQLKEKQEKARLKKTCLKPESQKPSKYNNKKTNGYDSKAEYHHAIVLNAMSDNGDITNLRKQVPYILQEAFTDSLGVKHRAIKYICDFEYYRDGKKIVEDVKSKFTAKNPLYKVKKKLFINKFPDVIFKEVIL